MAEPFNPSGDQAVQQAKQAAEQDIQATLGTEIEPDLDNLESLEAELDMEAVDLDQSVIDTVATDDVDDNIDEDGIEPDFEEEIIDDRPQALTESYGTGLQGQPSDRRGRYSQRSNALQYNEANPILTGGDIDANYEQANAVGDEAVGGTVMTPDQDVVDELGAAVGIEMDDRAFLRTEEMLVQRDDQRWELDPTSSEDYQERRE